MTLFPSRRNNRSILETARSFWKSRNQSEASQNRIIPSVENLEERTVPITTVNFAGNVLTLTQASAGAVFDDISISFAGGKIVVNEEVGLVPPQNAPANNPSAGSAPNGLVNIAGGTISNANQTWTSNAAFNGASLNINIVANAAGGTVNIQNQVNNGIGPINTDFAGPGNLRNVLITGTDSTEVLDFSNNTNGNIYLRIDSQGGFNNLGFPADPVTFSPVGVNILEYNDISANGAGGAQNLAFPNGGDAKVALDFSRLTKASGNVSINLSGPNSTIGGFNGLTLQMATPTETKFIDAIVGGPGDDVIIGNESDNLLIGRDGSDTLVGGGGNDQLNANRDYSPDVDAMPNGNAPAGLNNPYDRDDDLTQFVTTQGLFQSPSQTATTVFNNFGFFGFGEGTGAASDFTFANGLNPLPSNDILNGGDGNDAMFGFNNAAVTVLGGNGNDIYSTNINGGSALLNMGAGNDTLLYTNGDTAIGGLGDDSITAAGAGNTAVLTFLFGEGGNDTINGIAGPTEIRGGGGTNVLAFLDNLDTIISEGGTDNIMGGTNGATKVGF